MNREGYLFKIDELEELEGSNDALFLGNCIYFSPACYKLIHDDEVRDTVLHQLRLIDVDELINNEVNKFMEAQMREGYTNLIKELQSNA